MIAVNPRLAVGYRVVDVSSVVEGDAAGGMERVHPIPPEHAPWALLMCQMH